MAALHTAFPGRHATVEEEAGSASRNRRSQCVRESSRLRALVVKLCSALEALIPVWCRAGAAAVDWLLNLVAIIPFRRAKDSHWTERARVLYPARVAAVFSVWIFPTG